jgi:hypothetical protein
MDEKRFDNIFDHMMNMIEKLIKWFPIFFGAFAIFWAFLCVTVVILIILALTKYIGWW